MKKIQFTSSFTVRFTMIVAMAAASVGLFGAYHRVKAQDHANSAQLPVTTQPASAPSGSAGPTSATPGSARQASSQGLTGGAHSLDATYFSWGNDDNVPIASGYQPIDAAITATCPATEGCTIGFEQHIQLSGNQSANNAWGICTFVDGNYIHTPGCPFQGNLPTEGSYTVGTFAQQTSVAYGPHIVQTFVYTTSGGYKDTYNIIYRLYHP